MALHGSSHVRAAMPSAGLDDQRVAASYIHCREITRIRARNFYYGLKLSPEPQRSAMYVIYAWMRQADDIVDENTIGDAGGGEALSARLEEFRLHTDAALAGEPVNSDPLWIGLAATALNFRLPAELFHGVIDGQLDDLASRRYETFDQLRNYCYRVASTVGLLCIEVWGYHDQAARELAIDRGIAFQLTNIVRDFRQDFDTGRLYLPRAEFAEFGITPEDLRHWARPTPCEAMLRQQLRRAEVFYDRSAALDQMIAPACRPTLWAMTSIYRALLDKMLGDPSRVVLARRLRLSAWRKGAIALRAQWAVRAARAPHLGAATVGDHGA